MIEPKYLMLGDWVQVKNPSLGFYNVMGRIIAINEMEGHALSKTFDISFVDDEDHKIHYIGCPKYNVYPIPLTPEIFKKNGFFEEIVINADSNDDYASYHWNPTPQYPSDGLWFYPTFSGYAFDSRMSEIRIKYVHELQHLLHLCGIDKEINLT